MNRTLPNRAQAGFSLTELLIVIIIVGILAAIGLPAYQDYSRASKRSDAQQALSRMAQLQERYFTDNNRYAGNATALGYASNAPESTGGYWALTAAGDSTKYTVTAAPTNGHSDPECLTITLDSTGKRGSTGTGSGNDCWSGK